MKSKIILIFWRDLWIRICTVFAIIFHLAIWFLIFLKIMPIARDLEFLSLHYNIYFGVDLVGPWHQVFIIPALGLIFMLLNIFLTFFFYKKEKFLSRFLAAGNPLIELGLLVSIALITLLNI